MKFEVLTARGPDAERWTSLINQLDPGLRDIHFLPEYSRIYQDAYGFKSLLAYFHSADGFVIQPFVRRSLGNLPFLRDDADAGRFSDIANVYGFGGPVGAPQGRGAILYPTFFEHFSRWCNDENIASEFTCLHPLIAVEQRSLISEIFDTKYEKDVVVINLEQSEVELLGGLRKGHRSSVTRARRSGVEIEAVEPSKSNLALFTEMYEETMRRRQAAARWFLPSDFFLTTVRNLGADRTTLLMATVEKKLESACLLMHDFGTAYYHFAATFSQHPELGVNNLMVFEAALRLKAAGFRVLHLGGGVSSKPDDSLLLFKAGFSSLRAPLYTYFHIRNGIAYADLCKRKLAHEAERNEAVLNPDFLPLYRR